MQQRTETLLAAYLFLTAGLVLYFSSHLENWGLYFLVHCADCMEPCHCHCSFRETGSRF